MENTPRDQSAAGEAAAVVTVSTSSASFALLGFLLGCLPLGIPAVLAAWFVDGLIVLSWLWVTFGLYTLIWLGAIIILRANPFHGGRSLAKGLMWGAGLTGSLGLCGYLFILGLSAGMSGG